MKRVFFDYKPPAAFEDHPDFNFDVPYTLQIKRFLSDEVIPLHYGKTIEILLCSDLSGEIRIDNDYFRLGGNQVFVIPPNTVHYVHANSAEGYEGIMYVLKISLEAMSNYINLPAMLEYGNKSISMLPFTYPGYDKIYHLMQNLIEKDDNIFDCMISIISIFKLLQDDTGKGHQAETTARALEGSDLRELIKWTLDNYNRKITLDDVSKRMGYSKFYFCSRFKAMTGTTYLNYLNSVRVAHACHFLRQNKPISEICYLCGFENVSYFIQVFKKIKGMTPKSYALFSKKLKDRNDRKEGEANEKSTISP